MRHLCGIVLATAMPMAHAKLLGLVMPFPVVIVYMFFQRYFVAG